MEVMVIREGDPSRKGDWFQTYTGKVFYIMDPRPEDVCIEDIAHALARQCRFNGHVRCDHYSVAQHSVHVSQLVPEKLGLHALLHDAAEAYMGDIVMPLKRSLSDTRGIEDRLLSAVTERFDVVGTHEEWLQIREADMRMLVSEVRDLMGGQAFPWDIGAEPVEWTVEPWGAAFAEEVFLKAFDVLGGVR